MFNNKYRNFCIQSMVKMQEKPLKERIGRKAFFVVFLFLFWSIPVYSEDIAFSTFIEKIKYPLMYDASSNTISIDISKYSVGDSCTVDYGEIVTKFTYKGFINEGKFWCAIWQTTNFDKVKATTGEEQLTERDSADIKFYRDKNNATIDIVAIDPGIDRYRIQEFSVGERKIEALVIRKIISPSITREYFISNKVPTPGVPLLLTVKTDEFIFNARIIEYNKAR